jgi:hypothetical protein
MVHFQKLTRNLFLNFHWHTVSSDNCPSFLRATSSSLLLLTAGPRGQFPRWRPPVKGVLCAPFWGVQICDYSAAWVLCIVITPSWKLAPWPRSKHEKRTAGSARETWTAAAADGARCARASWEIPFLLTFKIALLFLYTLYYKMPLSDD